MIETSPQNRHLGYARVSTYGQTLDAQLQHDIAAVSTTVIAIFTIVLVYFTIKLAGSTRIAADAAKQSADAALRQVNAMIAVESPDPVIQPSPGEHSCP